jgi:hypothetical protein
VGNLVEVVSRGTWKNTPAHEDHALGLLWNLPGQPRVEMRAAAPQSPPASALASPSAPASRVSRHAAEPVASQCHCVHMMLPSMQRKGALAGQGPRASGGRVSQHVARPSNCVVHHWWPQSPGGRSLSWQRIGPSSGQPVGMDEQVGEVASMRVRPAPASIDDASTPPVEAGVPVRGRASSSPQPVAASAKARRRRFTARSRASYEPPTGRRNRAIVRSAAAHHDTREARRVACDASTPIRAPPRLRRTRRRSRSTAG